MNRSFVLLAALALLLPRTATAITPDAAQKLMKEVTPSLVAVQYTYEGELGRREFVGAGLVVSDDGLVMFPMVLTPPMLPDEQMKEFKIILPGDDLTEIDATFAGRDERSSVSFVRPRDKDAVEKAKWKIKPVRFDNLPVGVGDEVVSIGMLPKTASYQSYFTRCLVSANLRGENRHVLVTGEGLAAVGSPVFNKDGKAIGWVGMQAGQIPMLNDSNPQRQLQSMYAPPRMFLPTNEFAQSLADPLVAGQPLKLPWLGVAQMSGLKKEVAEYFGLTGQAAVQVGDVIKGTPADQAGLKPGNIIVKMNGKPLERGDEPDEAAMILTKNVKRMKVGSKVTFSIITQANKPPKDVTVTLAERPRQENQARRFFAEDLGFTAREIVFDDTYRRKLPADQKGVVVALVKQASAAMAGKLENGDLITKLNQTPVTDVEQFKKEYQAFRKAKPREAVVLEAIRQGNDEIIRIEPPQ
ncbi:MAG TPA: PDZ domain-containing protein [Tepidisphaeraceae bacterium]